MTWRILSKIEGYSKACTNETLIHHASVNREFGDQGIDVAISKFFFLQPSQMYFRSQRISGRSPEAAKRFGREDRKRCLFFARPGQGTSNRGLCSLVRSLLKSENP